MNRTNRDPTNVGSAKKNRLSFSAIYRHYQSISIFGSILMNYVWHWCVRERIEIKNFSMAFRIEAIAKMTYPAVVEETHT